MADINKKILNTFGKDFIKSARNNTLEKMEMIINGKMKSQEAQIIYKKIKELPIKDKSIIKEIITETIDRTIFEVLNFFEEEEQYIIGYDNEGEIININELSDGLTGELYGEEGWIKKHGKK
jgi:hypothetical protein